MGFVLRLVIWQWRRDIRRQQAQLEALLAHVDDLEAKLDELTRILKNPPYCYEYTHSRRRSLRDETLDA
jgi:hypothetical protein